mgnify:FL=1
MRNPTLPAHGGIIATHLIGISFRGTSLRQPTQFWLGISRSPHCVDQFRQSWALVEVADKKCVQKLALSSSKIFRLSATSYASTSKATHEHSAGHASCAHHTLTRYAAVQSIFEYFPPGKMFLCQRSHRFHHLSFARTESDQRKRVGEQVMH